MRVGAPYYRTLPAEQINRIDEAARGILERVGIHCLNAAFLDVLEQAGATVDRRDRRVRFPPAWLHRALSAAPRHFTLYSRDGRNDLVMGEDEVHFGNGGCVFRVLDVETGKFRLSTLRDIANTAGLVEHLERLRFYVIACQAHDVPPGHYHLNDFYYAFRYTNKHVMGGCTDLAGVRQMHRLAACIAGGEPALRERPFVTVITNPVSPLSIDGDTLEIIRFCGRHGIPVTCAPAPIAAATAPVTLAGTLVQTHAEALAGVALAQVLSPGAKVLYGAFPTIMDLRTMAVSVGAVEMGMMNAAAVQLAKLHGLPIYASGGVTEAKQADVQAGFEKNFSNLTVALSGADCIHLTAGLMDSANAISYQQFAIDDENIGMIRRILHGIEVDEERLALDEIASVGPGGHYLMQEQTLRYMDSEFFYPDLSERCTFDVWEQKGRPTMLKRAKQRVRTILREQACSVLNPELDRRIRARFPEIIPFSELALPEEEDDESG
ncbi:MAG: trimethylamine methyltransferase family protein [Lentisphaerae bacterium]|nr:trimethylamine methyltransferase family protein [Lentisphaerota bacterium]